MLIVVGLCRRIIFALSSLAVFGNVFVDAVFAQPQLAIGQQHFKTANLIGVTDDELVFEVEGKNEQVRCGHSELTRYGSAKLISSRASISLIDGTVLVGRLQSIEQEAVLIRTKFFGGVSVPMAFVLNVVFDRHVSPNDLAHWQRQMLSRRFEEDRMWASCDQFFAGEFSFVNASDQPYKIEFREQGAETGQIVSSKNTFGVSFSRPQLELLPAMSIFFTDGSVVNVRGFNSKDSDLESLDARSTGDYLVDLTMRLNLPIEVQARQISLGEIQSIESFENEEFLFQKPLAASRFRSELSDEIPHGVESSVFGTRVDSDGFLLNRVIAQHANSTLVFNVDPASNYFAASLRPLIRGSQHGEQALRFDAKCRVLAVENGRLRELIEIPADQAIDGPYVVCDLNNATSIVLAIESTDSEIAGDQIGWFDARVGQ